MRGEEKGDVVYRERWLLKHKAAKAVFGSAVPAEQKKTLGMLTLRAACPHRLYQETAGLSVGYGIHI